MVSQLVFTPKISGPRSALRMAILWPFALTPSSGARNSSVHPPQAVILRVSGAGLCELEVTNADSSE
jgi:hypothetical protein